MSDALVGMLSSFFDERLKSSVGEDDNGNIVLLVDDDTYTIHVDKKVVFWKGRQFKINDSTDSEFKARLYFWELLIYRLYLDLTEPTERFKGEEQLLDLGFEFKPSASVSPDVYTLLDTSWEVHIEYMPTITDFRAILRPQVFLNGSLVQVFDRWLDNNLSNLIKFLKANAPVKQVER